MSGKMSIEQHRARLQKTYERWLHEVWGNGNVEIVDEVLADSFVDHRPIPRFGPTREGHKRLAADWHAAFPDMKLMIEDVVIKGDRLVGRDAARTAGCSPAFPRLAPPSASPRSMSSASKAIGSPSGGTTRMASRSRNASSSLPAWPERRRPVAPSSASRRLGWSHLIDIAHVESVVTSGERWRA